MQSTMDNCPRARTDCTPKSGIQSDCGGSFICCGLNRPEDRTVAQDIYTVCWKNDVIDERSHWDERDIIDTISVLSTALSIEANKKAGDPSL